MPTIYEELGQETGIRGTVDAFNERLLADPQLAHYFAGIDQRTLRWHQATLLSTITGGPSTYKGRDLGDAHAHLGVGGEDFLRVVEHLVGVLEESGVSSASIDAVVSALALHKDNIVAKETVATGSEGVADEIRG